MKEVEWICVECGEKFGNRKLNFATFHIGTCDICGSEVEVTEPRDFGYLNMLRLNDFLKNK